MITTSPKHRIFLGIKPVDFRKGIHALAKLCQAQYQLDPFSGHYFIFCNRRKTDLKLLYYDSQGFCLFHKRLSTGRFTGWPNADSTLVTLTPAQLHVLLDNGQPALTHTAPPWQPIDDDP